jgi:hypothetical protein
MRLSIHAPTISCWVDGRLFKDLAKPHVIVNPCPNNILLGRREPIQGRPANVRFREMLDKDMDKYYDKGGKGANAIFQHTLYMW